MRLGEEGDISVLVIEQNIGVATAISKNVAIMVNGRVNRIIESAPSGSRPRAAAALARCRRSCRRRRRGNGGRASRRSVARATARRRYGADPHLHFQPHAADPLVAAGADCADRGRGAHALDRRDAARRCAPASAGKLRRNKQPDRRSCLIVGTLDTKGEELRFIRDIIAESGLRTRLVDVSTSGKLSTCDVSAQEIALNHGRGGSAVFGTDRGASVTAMADAFAKWLRRQGNVAGIISAGGSGGASLVAPGMRDASRRRAQADHLLGRLGRCRPLCRARRHHHDVFGHGRAGPQFDLARSACQRRERDGRHGEGAAGRARHEATRRDCRSACRSASPCSA